ncbi:hypothetical protein PVN32_24710 [Bacillus paralicheniformis]|uniref:Uncharacterized protein n=1 Tax=Bacillus paralicheniformis TaxID=1648923 RepID=A0AAW6KNI1_9BACI|nr:hypothetical protein [Bacillus paralicheniformis]MDE1383301.1 hypothetical protein [Bacillus paralicheniformis]MDE1455306.1 hypothetical protein [Bacillus paralicheniformis]
MDKALMHEMITELQQRTKAGELDRIQRIEEITALADAYFDAVGEHPDSTALERMANLVIYEELTNPHPDKMAREEYPIMSETQREERIKSEASEKLAEEYGADGRNYKVPTRRKRSSYEEKFVDRAARARNKERRNRYNDFVKGKTPGQFTVNIATGEKIGYAPNKVKQ